MAGVRPSIEAPLVYEEVNVRGTLTLLETARKFALERFVLVSSSTVYGMGAVAPFREEGPLGLPLSPYGVTKRAAELLGLTYHQLHGVPVVCLRPFSVYGPRMRPDLAMFAFASAMLEDRPVVLFGDGSIERDFTHVSDICTGILAALREPQAIGETFNLGHHQPVSIRGLLELLEAAVGKRARIDSRPVAEGDMPLTCADLTKSQRVLGYRPQVALEDGAGEFVRWLRESRGL
jgi:UDP-glucuronate 4-epimerase